VDIWFLLAYPGPWGKKALADQGLPQPLRVWQCTYVGGPRFAANVLVFPEGLYYGRLSSADTTRLTTATYQGKILLGHFRGRSSYNPVIQAAESHLRTWQDAVQFGRFKFQKAREVGEDHWQVFFKDIHEMAVCQLDLRIDPASDQDFQSCKGDKQVYSLFFELVDYKILRDPSNPNPG
jgi:hypothetical protein